MEGEEKKRREEEREWGRVLFLWRIFSEKKIPKAIMKTVPLTCMFFELILVVIFVYKISMSYPEVHAGSVLSMCKYEI